jgi:DNA processing protein
MDSTESLELALVAFASVRTPGRISSLLRSSGRKGLREIWGSADASLQDRLRSEAAELRDQQTGVLFYGDEDYPDSLVRNQRPVAPILFYRGDPRMFTAPGVGMCGSRRASDLGLKAARACGEEVSERGMTVVSGYAKGVDTETHLAALRGGGRTVIVLAEGFNHFTVKKTFAEDFDPSRILLVSQFPPTQSWGAYAAMSRNEVIFGLGEALVVIEAGERGGTLAAGQGALKSGKAVFVLDFGEETPPGNRALLRAGGRAVGSRKDLGRALQSLESTMPIETVQRRLPI